MKTALIGRLPQGSWWLAVLGPALAFACSDTGGTRIYYGSAAGTGGSEPTAGGGTGATVAGKGGASAEGGSDGTAEGGSGGTSAGEGGSGATAEGGSGATDGGSGPEGGAAGSGTAPDETAPTVLSISPADGAMGVASDAAIVITFSEPVHQLSAQNAFDTDVGNVTFSWDETGTVLTATPNSPLLYATSDDQNVAALSYSASIGTGVQDLAGNALAAAASSQFSTLRQISAEISLSVADVQILDSAGYMYDGSSDAGAYVGDGFNNSYYRAVADFDISSLPDGLQSFVDATLSVDMYLSNPTGGSNWGTPFTDLGNLNVVHIFDDTIEAGSIDLTPIGTVGVLISTVSPLSGIKTIDVTSALANDFAERDNRGSRSQYRIQFATKTNNDGATDMITVKPFTTLYIDVEYLIP